MTHDFQNIHFEKKSKRIANKSFRLWAFCCLQVSSIITRVNNTVLLIEGRWRWQTRTHSHGFLSVDLRISVFKVPEVVRSHILLIFEDCLDYYGGGRASLAKPLLPASNYKRRTYFVTNMPLKTERQHKQPVGRLRHTFNTSFNFSYESSNTKVIVLKIRSQCVRRDVHIGQISKKEGRYRNKYIQGIRVIRVCITEEGELKYFYYKWYKCNGTWWSSISFQFYWNDLLCFLLTQNTTPLVFSTLFGRSDLKAPEGMGLNIGLKHI